MIVLRDKNNLPFLIIIIRNWKLFENTGQYLSVCQMLTKFWSYLGEFFLFQDGRQPIIFEVILSKILRIEFLVLGNWFL